MSLLYLVTESDQDADFYHLCAEEFGRRQCPSPIRLRNRKADGSNAAKDQAKLALQQAVKLAGGEEEVCFVVAIDNDRSPNPENDRSLNRAKLYDKERRSPSVLLWIEGIVAEVLGNDARTWPLRVGIAVPVEMIESWTVKALGEDRPSGPLPHFSRQDDASARRYYHPVAPPLQWKDLENLARGRCGKLDAPSFYRHVVATISNDPEAMCGKSRSFDHFHQQLAAW